MQPTILHVLSRDIARGAQRYAHNMRTLLDGGGQRHRTLTLFESDPVALHPDASLHVPCGPLRRLGFDPRVLVRLRALLVRERPAVLVTHGSEPLKYSALAVPWGTPLVHYKIGMATHQVRRPGRRGLHRWILSRARVVAGVSQECLDEARDLLRVPRERLFLVPNGRDPAVYCPPAQRRRRGRPRIVFVGHLVPKKRPERFVRVVRAVRARGLDAEAALVGDGPLLPWMRELGATTGIEVMGRRDDVAAILADADLLVFTSEVAGEGMPGIFIEAGMCGLPVVATRVPGASAVIDDGVTGFVVDVEDFEALVDRAARLTADPDLRAEMGNAAVRRCRALFTIEASVARWHDLLQSMITRR